MALTWGGFRLESAIAAHPPADCPTTMTSFGSDAFFGGHVVDDPEIDLRNRQAGSAEIGIAAFSDFGEEGTVEAMLGYVDGRCAISGADGGHHEIAALGKPLGGVAEFHERERSCGRSG